MIFLSQTFEKKGTEEFAVFFEHNGKGYRLDWSVDLDLNVSDEQIKELMAQHIANELADEEYMETIGKEAFNVERLKRTIKEWEAVGYKRRYTLE